MYVLRFILDAKKTASRLPSWLRLLILEIASFYSQIFGFYLAKQYNNLIF